MARLKTPPAPIAMLPFNIFPTVVTTVVGPAITKELKSKRSLKNQFHGAQKNFDNFFFYKYSYYDFTVSVGGGGAVAEWSKALLQSEGR